MELDFKYPGIILIIALIAAYFIIKFYMSKENLNRKSYSYLFVLKYIFFSLLILFVFDPVITRTSYTEKTRKHLVMFDNSRSLGLNDPSDSVLFKTAASEIIKEKSFVPYVFGNDLRPLSQTGRLDFQDGFTNISNGELTATIEKIIPEENIRSLVILTDGNFTDADNLSLKFGLPVNIIYGSLKSAEPDIFFDDLIYRDNPLDDEETKFTAIIGCAGNNAGGNFTLKVSEKGKTIKTLTVRIPENNSFVSVNVELPELTNDFRELEFSIDPLEKEKNTFNNKKSAYQKKLRSTDNFLIMANSPSLDLAFLLKLLKTEGYNFSIVYENYASDSVISKNYRSLICFGCPSSSSGKSTSELINKFSSKMFFLNKSTNPAKLNSLLKTGLTSFNYVPAEGKLIETKSGEGGFLLSRASKPIILERMPEVTYNSAFFPAENIFRSLLDISNSLNSKAVYQFKDAKSGIYIVNFSSFWKLLFNDSDDNSGRLIINLIDLLSSDGSRDRIRIGSLKDEYYSGEKIFFKGKILDENSRSSENAGVELYINENSMKSKFRYEKNEYISEIFIKEPGIYSAAVTLTEGGGKVTVKNIDFKIIENDIETQKLGADTTFIKNFTAARDGMIIPPDSAKAYLAGLTGKTDTIAAVRQFNFTRNIFYFIILAAVFLFELTYRKYKDLS